jgi:hypothetical protein
VRVCVCVRVHACMHAYVWLVDYFVLLGVRHCFL